MYIYECEDEDEYLYDANRFLQVMRCDSLFNVQQHFKHKNVVYI